MNIHLVSKSSETFTLQGKLTCVVYNCIFAAATGLLCFFAFVQASHTTHGCLWPAEWDTLRDMGMAQAMLDGRYPEDPILSGETLWYNPLTGAIIAAASSAFHRPLNETSIILGPYVNLLIPVGIALLLWYLFGRTAALAGVCMVLFAKDPQIPFWVNAGYSPWLLAPLYSLGLFFFTLAVFNYALSRRSLTGHIASGVLLGITFMAHTAPALVTGGIMLLMTAAECVLFWWNLPREEGDDKKDWLQLQQILLHFCILLAVAFVVSLPFTWSILWNYQFRIQNPFPSLFAADYVSLAQLPERLYDGLNWRNLFAAAGLLALLRRLRRDRAARLVLCWFVVALCFVVQHYTWQYLLSRGIVISALVPGHHAAIHLSAVRVVLFAVGAVFFGESVVSLLQHTLKWEVSASLALRLKQAGAVALTICACLALYLEYPLTNRPDFMTPDRVLYQQFHEQGIPMYQWILANTGPDAVFLCEQESTGMTVVMPAGRKLVAAMLLYSNPYVPVAPLFEAQKKLLESIEFGDRAGFCATAAHYPELYLLTLREKSESDTQKYAVFFEKLTDAGNLTVWRARACTS